MGYQFKRQSGNNPFVIDQTRTIKFSDDGFRATLVEKYAGDLAKYGGTAGFLAEEAPSGFGRNTGADAFVLSTQNELE